jgi:hypothetical protein
MARTRVSYSEAVRLLLGAAPGVAAQAGRIAGGLLLAATPLSPETVLSLFDAKGEANNLLRDLVDRAPGRIKAARGKRHYELLEAAHGLLVLSAFFDAVAEIHGPRFAALELTDEEKHRIGVTSALGARFSAAVVTTPGLELGFVENLLHVTDEMGRLATAFTAFAKGLAAGRDLPAIGETETGRAVEIYREGYIRLAADVPEFAIWSGLEEHAATRAEIRRQDLTLAHLEQMLRQIVEAPTPASEAERRLADHYLAMLRAPVWPAEEDISFPTVEQGFISPRFRLARADKDAKLTDEDWWEQQPEHENLTEFLTHYLTDPISIEQPLVILGLPGAGKSLLTKVLAARLPADVFTTFRVPLRAVDAADDIGDQVSAAVKRLINERLEWADLCRASDTTKVVLLDGFDELIQATGATQSHYLKQAARFQANEWLNGRPVAVVVTSRTLVMDRTAVPTGTLVVKLEPFDQEQVAHWTGTWNTVNDHRPSFRPLTPAELEHHAELAGQPLLLLMLAIYAAAGETTLDAEHMSTEDLYRRLLDAFIRRQIRDKAPEGVPEHELAAQEAQSRLDLATVAFAMFNRGSQWVTEEDLDADMRGLYLDRTTHDGELTPARRAITGFFFVHVAHNGDQPHAPARHTYEFMHATFGEYLIAEQLAALLKDLGADWARSRNRMLGSAVDVRTLRTLLSHQPLSSRPQALTFLETLLSPDEPAERQLLQKALLDLLRGARQSVPDDPYRPRPFDVVHHLAAYTANLVLLATLCAMPDGLPVIDLCTASSEPNLTATVRLWRSGMDPVTQRGLFNRLIRVGDRLRVETPNDYHSLPVAEARLTGDALTESVLRSGERMLFGVPDEADDAAFTQVQSDLHLAVVDVIAARWPTRLLPRSMPHDEQLYVKVVELAEKMVEPPAVDTARALAKVLIDDYSRLPEELTGRMISAVFRPSMVIDLQPLLSVLMLERPELLERHPALREKLLETPFPVYTYEVALAARNQGAAALSEFITALAEQVKSGGNLIGYEVLPSMLNSLHTLPHELATAVRAMGTYRPHSWQQVRPADMLAAINVLDGNDEFWYETSEAVSQYVADRQHDNFDGADSEALRELSMRCATEPAAPER